MQKLFICLLLFCIFNTPLFAQIQLNGTLVTDAEKHVPDTRISVAGGPSDITDSKGQFSIKLSLDFIEGERVILIVDKKDWVINHPLDGEWNLPNIKLQNVQYTKVIIVPKGSKRLWTHQRIEKHIGLLSDEIAKLKKESDQPKPIDFSYYLSQWADKYGFTLDEVKAAFDQWAKSIKPTDSKRTLALREFYQKNFAQAAEYFEEAAIEDEAILKEIEEARRQKILQIYENWKDAGNSLSNLYQFKTALIKYEKAKKKVPKGEFFNEWAEIEILIGKMNYELGIRVEGEQSQKYLNDALESSRRVEQESPRSIYPKKWAMAQHEIGKLLSEQGIRTAGEQGAQLLGEAIAAYRLVLQVRTRDQLPQQWAATQNNLGNALKNQGIRTAGEQGAQLLAEAVAAYRLALQVRTRDQLPQDWAISQNNLGIALKNQGIRTAGEQGAQLLADAVAAYRLALQVYTRDQLPQQWAATQNNLGAALSEQGIRTAGEQGAQLLSEAVATYRLALEVRTREQLPQQWAATQNNLGTALSDQGIRTAGEQGAQLLAEAVAAYRLALQVYTRDQLPQDWAMTQNNLGIALKDQGIRTAGEQGAQLLAEAVAAYRLALEIRTFEHLPMGWAQTQNNLAETFTYLQDWQNTADCYANVLKVYPDYEKAYRIASYLYHNVLFNFPAAYQENKSWLELNPDDISAQCDFVEQHFTSSRFSECEKLVVSLLKNPEIDTHVNIALRAIEIANLVALNKTSQIPDKLDNLVSNITSQPDTFKVNWSFEGTKHFISQNEKLAPYRQWLIQLFEALEQEGRENILVALKAVRESWE